jgi:hypothetical protein
MYKVSFIERAAAPRVRRYNRYSHHDRRSQRAWQPPIRIADGKISSAGGPNGYLDVPPDRRLADLELGGADLTALAQCAELGQPPQRVPLRQRFATNSR